ncbi:MAG: C39 family peptidase [Phycisphaerales bacterium JB040]
MSPGTLALTLLVAGATTPPAVPARAHTHDVHEAHAPTDAPLALTETGVRFGPFGLDGRPVDHALASWIVRTEDGAGARLDVRVVTGGVPSPWLTLARTGDPDALSDLPAERDRAEGARVYTDVLACDPPGEGVELRLLASGGEATLTALWVTLTDEAEPPAPLGELDVSALLEPVPGPVALDVPHHAQNEAGPELASRLCSPTSVAMTLAYHGHARTVAEVAADCYDPDAEIYGNWVNNTLAASRLGVPTLATRLGSWGELEAALGHGPVVLSLPPFTPDTLGGVTYESKSGHLLVARGFDDSGDLLVSDPAHGDPDEARATYSREDLTRLWLLENLGTCYLPAAALGDVAGAKRPHRD